jgi:hypothetical protein
VPMTRGAIGRVELAAGLCRRRLTAVGVLEARGREGGMVKIGRTCPPHRGRHGADESAGGHDKRWPPPRPSQHVPYGVQDSIRNCCASAVARHSGSLHRRLRINRQTMATLLTLRTARRDCISSAGGPHFVCNIPPWRGASLRLNAPLRVFYAGQRAPPPASSCSPVNQWESSEARNTAIDAMSFG